jgi:GGDEF domain-containing protein
VSAPRSLLVGDRVGLRITDVAAELSRDRFIALLIETGREEAEALVERIQRESGSCEVRVASFPEDALTLDELIERVL